MGSREEPWGSAWQRRDSPAESLVFSVHRDPYLTPGCARAGREEQRNRALPWQQGEVFTMSEATMGPPSRHRWNTHESEKGSQEQVTSTAMVPESAHDLEYLPKAFVVAVVVADEVGGAHATYSSSPAWWKWAISPRPQWRPAPTTKGPGTCRSSLNRSVTCTAVRPFR